MFHLSSPIAYTTLFETPPPLTFQALGYIMVYVEFNSNSINLFEFFLKVIWAKYFIIAFVDRIAFYKKYFINPNFMPVSPNILQLNLNFIL